jgi:hypothetical protein
MQNTSDQYSRPQRYFFTVGSRRNATTGTIFVGLYAGIACSS